MLRREKQPHQAAGLGGNRAKLRDHRFGARSQRVWIGRVHDRSSTLMAVSSMASKLIRTCITMVSVVEPLAQRNQPSIRPAAKICAIPSQSYWMCSNAQANEMTTMASLS